jgi:hypothetical protein
MLSVENIMIIYLNGSNFLLPISHCLFLLPNVDATLLRPLIFLGSASIVYIPLYCPLFFSIVLDLILLGSNKGYCTCSPCHHFHTFYNIAPSLVFYCGCPEISFSIVCVRRTSLSDLPEFSRWTDNEGQERNYSRKPGANPTSSIYNASVVNF